MTVVGLCAAAAVGILWVDDAVGDRWGDVVSIDAARSFQVTVAGTMITATVVVFWIRGLLVSIHAGNFPNRVLSGYLNDHYQRALMGLMVGVFVFATIVLFALPPSPHPGEPAPAVPMLSLVVTAVATVVALLAIIQSVASGSNQMHEQRILRRILDAALQVVERDYPASSEECSREVPALDDREAAVIRSSRIGWLWSVDEERLLGSLPPGAMCRREVRIGALVTPATKLCAVWSPDGVGDVADDVEEAFELGETRSPSDDISFALRNVVDVALSGTSGVIDRTNAREAVAHLEAILRPILIRDGPAPARRDTEGRWIVRNHQPDYVNYVNEAFDDLRHLGSDAPTARILLDVIDDLADAAITAGKPERVSLLRRHADLIVEEARRGGAIEADVRRLEVRAHRIVRSAIWEPDAGLDDGVPRPFAGMHPEPSGNDGGEH